MDRNRMDKDRSQGAAGKGEAFIQLDPELEARLEDVGRMGHRAATRCGVSGDEADDIVQELTDYARKRLKLTPGFLRDVKKRAAYVKNAVRNKCADRARAEKAAKNREFAVGHWLYSRRSSVFNPLHWLDIWKDSHLEHDIRRLPPQVSEIIFRLYYRDETLTEVAFDLGITPQSVYTQEKRGLAKLKAAYLKREYGPPPRWDRLHPRETPKRPKNGDR